VTPGVDSVRAAIGEKYAIALPEKPGEVLTNDSFFFAFLGHNQGPVLT
jgi:hypothetical protein